MSQAVRHDSMRASNLEVVLGEVSRRGPLTRAALAELTGLTKSTVSKLVGDLIDAGILAESGLARAGERGRPGVDVVLSGARVAALGLEINVDYLAVCLVDLTREVRRDIRRERDNRERPEAVLAELRTMALEVLGEAKELGLTVAGAGLALSGPVGDGLLVSAPNLGWRDVRAAELLDLPVAVELDNEANLAALGELWFGAGERDFLYVSGEIGIGAGLVVNGELFRGPNGLAGELGHVVVSPDGPECRCGGRGCLETYAGQEVLLGKEQRAGEALGVALASAVNLFDVDRIVLGGIFAPLFPQLGGPIERVLRDRLSTLRGGVPTLTASGLGARAATLGAAGRVIHRVLAEPGAYLRSER
ncbi:ROK family protein [Amycolatopsis sp. NPDC059657]|uniref:ROK family protein n=1 Tax=Amycolatopsis sp. NPDC059657 TaxID=3346899 RepID=UPI00366A6E6C